MPLLTEDKKCRIMSQFESFLKHRVQNICIQQRTIAITFYIVTLLLLPLPMLIQLLFLLLSSHSYCS